MSGTTSSGQARAPGSNDVRARTPQARRVHRPVRPAGVRHHSATRPATGLSVCVPARNAARTLEATLRSVLDQDVEFELVVLDNASDDGTGELARSFHDERIRVVRNEALLAIGHNWNRVVELSTGQLVKIVCADDVLRPGALAAQLDIMQDPTIALVSAMYDVIDEAGALVESGLGLPGLVGRHEARTVMGTIVRRGPAEFGPTAAATFRREHFDRVGGFRPDLVFPMDVDLFARVTSFGSFVGMPERVAAWRNSTFNLCASTSTLSKLTEMLRFHHRIAADYREFVSAGDVLAGDLRLVRAGLDRLRVRASALLPGRSS